MSAPRMGEKIYFVHTEVYVHELVDPYIEKGSSSGKHNVTVAK